MVVFIGVFQNSRVWKEKISSLYQLGCYAFSMQQTSARTLLKCDQPKWYLGARGPTSSESLSTWGHLAKRLS